MGSRNPTIVFCFTVQLACMMCQVFLSLPCHTNGYYCFLRVFLNFTMLHSFKWIIVESTWESIGQLALSITSVLSSTLTLLVCNNAIISLSLLIFWEKLDQFLLSPGIFVSYTTVLCRVFNVTNFGFFQHGLWRSFI